MDTQSAEVLKHRLFRLERFCQSETVLPRSPAVIGYNDDDDDDDDNNNQDDTNVDSGYDVETNAVDNDDILSALAGHDELGHL